MRLDKIYTKVGDQGHTRLATGEKVLKTHLRIKAYGTVDELNSFCGLLADSIEKSNVRLQEICKTRLKHIQNSLFDLGGELSFSDGKAPEYVQNLTANHTKLLEDDIDSFNVELEPLANFILPGGNFSQSVCHLARTTCRRAEREVVELSEAESVRPEIMIFLNRLSDWFFVYARLINKLTNTPEVLWEQNKP